MEQPVDADGPPHLALFLVLAYLPLHQLLSISQVCRSFRDAISSDVLIWLDIIVERPLNRRLTDEILMRITSKAHGRLRTLALLNCFKITDDGLLRVVKQNPFINKLYIPACTGLTPQGVLMAVKTLAENKPSALTKLRANGIYNLNQEHLETLQSSLPKRSVWKARFYHRYDSFSFRSLDEDNHPIDVETCSRCKDIKLVFNCPGEMCRARRDKKETQCQGCSHCIPRCEGCGRCIVDEDEQGETICNDTLCLDCWLQLAKCNHCNRPVCPRHVDEQLNPQSSGEFVCYVCRTKST